MAVSGIDLIIENVRPRWTIEWSENDPNPETGGTFHAEILQMGVSEDMRLNLVLAWCAQMHPGRGGGTWYLTQRRLQLSLSQGMLQSARMAEKGEIDFDAEGKVGTFFPPSLGLTYKNVRKAPPSVPQPRVHPFN